MKPMMASRSGKGFASLSNNKDLEHLNPDLIQSKSPKRIKTMQSP